MAIRSFSITINKKGEYDPSRGHTVINEQTDAYIKRLS